MSENIFTELYNRILGLFGQSITKEESKNTAVNRLRLVLMQDRTNLTPEILHRMRSELIEVLSKYVELDKEALELNFEQEGEQMALMLSIPVVRAKEESEIEEILKLEDEKKAKAEAEATDDETEDSQESEEDENTDEDFEESESEQTEEAETQVSENIENSETKEETDSYDSENEEANNSSKDKSSE